MTQQFIGDIFVQTQLDDKAIRLKNPTWELTKLTIDVANQKWSAEIILQDDLNQLVRNLEIQVDANSESFINSLIRSSSFEKLIIENESITSQKNG